MSNFNATYFWECVKGAVSLKNLQYSSMKYSREFSWSESVAIRALLDECGRSVSAKVRFYWNDKMGCDCVACFAVAKPNCVFVSEYYRAESDSKNFVKLAGPVAHELRHRWQFLVLMPLYVLACLPLVRNLTIEIDAERVGASVDKFLGVSEAERL